VVFRVLAHGFRAKASAEGPSGKRALPSHPLRQSRRTRVIPLIGLPSEEDAYYRII
jgi:hypothetical protein